MKSLLPFNQSLQNASLIQQTQFLPTTSISMNANQATYSQSPTSSVVPTKYADSSQLNMTVPMNGYYKHISNAYASPASSSFNANNVYCANRSMSVTPRTLIETKRASTTLNADHHQSLKNRFVTPKDSNIIRTFPAFLKRNAFEEAHKINDRRGSNNENFERIR